ncbi:MAG: hypothetical protein FJ304_11335 [Planctomycetes bacterium]|nr:hypothetical protein [Planctomycetota bacterium]
MSRRLAFLGLPLLLSFTGCSCTSQSFELKVKSTAGKLEPPFERATNDAGVVALMPDGTAELRIRAAGRFSAFGLGGSGSREQQGTVTVEVEAPAPLKA